MSLIYGYNDEKDGGGNGGENVSDLKKLVGEKTDDRTTNTAFGKIQNNKENIQTKSILLGSRADSRAVNSAFGKIKGNRRDIQTSNNLVGSSSSLEGEPTLKGTQLSHASAITAHAHNLLNLEDAVGLKTDSKTADTAFGRIQKNKENIENFKGGTGLKETTGTFIAPFNDGKVEITGWTMTHYSTIIAIIIKAKQTLFGVSRVTLYSGVSSSDNSHTMTVPMRSSDMKLGKPAVMVYARDPGHTKMYANTRGNAIGSVGDRTVSVKFIYIDHTT